MSAVEAEPQPCEVGDHPLRVRSWPRLHSCSGAHQEGAYVRQMAAGSVVVLAGYTE
jgi:hypothetical protein